MADDRGVDVTGFCPIHLGMVLKKMELMGIECERIENGVHVSRVEHISRSIFRHFRSRASRQTCRRRSWCFPLLLMAAL